jgi:hypothetical protein
METEEEFNYEAEVARVKTDIEAWHKEWPKTCKTCRGWGGTEVSGNYWNPPEFWFCSRLENDTTLTCCRCGQAEALTEDLEGPCKWCGWNFDDGEPNL